MYVRTWHPSDPVVLDSKLMPGQVIEPEPPLTHPYWCWGGACSTFPLEALGVGVVKRLWQKGPCAILEPCTGGESLGFLKRTNIFLSQEGLFGFRVQRADGWHLGWLHLRNPIEGPPSGSVELLASAVHPEPEKALAAGEPARPELAVRREGEEIVLSWATVWTGYTLERSPALRPPVWEAVSGVSANAIRLPRTDAPAFFRLKR
jgi:hypothetical protein